MQAILKTEATTILRLKRTVPFSAIRRVWDLRTQRIVSGAELKDGVRHEADLRHPAIPNPVPPDRVDNHVGVSKWMATTHTKVPQANRQQAVGESAGHIKQGVGHAATISEVVRSATDQTSATTTMDCYAPVLVGYMGPWALSHLVAVLVCDLDHMLDDVLWAPHLPVIKTAGVILNKVTRPI